MSSKGPKVPDTLRNTKMFLSKPPSIQKWIANLYIKGVFCKTRMKLFNSSSQRTTVILSQSREQPIANIKCCENGVAQSSQGVTQFCSRAQVGWADCTRTIPLKY